MRFGTKFFTHGFLLSLGSVLVTAGVEHADWGTGIVGALMVGGAGLLGGHLWEKYGD